MIKERYGGPENSTSEISSSSVFSCIVGRHSARTRQRDHSRRGSSRDDAVGFGRSEQTAGFRLGRARRPDTVALLYMTCIAAGLDNRFKAAVPVYGCGFLHENSVWLHYTTGTTPINKLDWETVRARIEGKRIVAPAPPDGATIWFLTVGDNREAVVSSELVFSTAKQM